MVAVVAVSGAVAAVALTRDNAPPSPTNEVAPPAVTPQPAESPLPPDASDTTDSRLVVGEHYSVRIPSGFEREGPGIYHEATRPGENSYTESQWRSTEDADTEIHIDYTAGLSVSVEEAARGVRERRHKGSSFREYSFAAYTRDDGSEAWRWHFSTGDGGVTTHRVAYYLGGCDTGYALLGIAPDSAWDRLADVFDATEASLRPLC